MTARTLVPVPGFDSTQKTSVYQTHSFLHTHKSQSAALLGLFYVKARTLVLHDKLNLISRCSQFHSKLAYLAVLHSIMQRFLRHSKQTEGNVFRQLTGYIVSVNLMLTSCCLENSWQNPRIADAA